jgi:hypothetical protein
VPGRPVRFSTRSLPFFKLTKGVYSMRASNLKATIVIIIGVGGSDRHSALKSRQKHVCCHDCR